MTVSDPNTVADRQAAACVLVAQPLVLAHGPHADVFRLIRKHADWLIEQFSQLLGYRLVVEAGFARLYKTALADASRPGVRSGSSTPLTPRAYAYLTLVVSVLLTSREQLLLSGLVTDLRAAAAEADIEVGDSVTERRALVAALRLLVEWGVLVEDENAVAGYADGGPDVLLTVHRDLVRHLVAGPLRQAESPADLIERAGSAIVGGARHRVRRRLVETPVVYRDDLDDEDRAWMAQYQRREEAVLGDFLGATLEIRAEGTALFHPELTDREFPGSGTVAQAALLTVSDLAARLRPSPVPNPRDALVVGVPIPDGLFEEILDGYVARHHRRWGQAWVEDAHALADEVRRLLADMHLIAPADVARAATRGNGMPGGWVLLAAAARYVAEETIVAPPEPVPDLFGALT